MNTPYHLSNFLQAGIIQLPLALSDVDSSIACDHHEEDGWHQLAEVNLEAMVNPAFEKLAKSICFLIQHRYIAATYRLPLNSESLVVRVYLIPYDLPRVGGRLSYLTRKRENPQVLGEARRHMSELLPRIIQDLDTWKYGRVRTAASNLTIIRVDNVNDARTLAEIYSSLPSPQPALHGYMSPLVKRLLDFNDPLDGLGLKSTLHKYQRESVAAMLEREASNYLDLSNPLYIPIEGLDGRIFFYQPGTTEIVQEQSIVSVASGGILCEELGTGKTIMILALILGTMKQLSRPEESFIDARPILTPLAFRHFPFSEFAAIRKRFPLVPKDKSSPDSIVPSFRELLLHQLCTNPDASVPDRTSQAGVAADNRNQYIVEMLERVPMYNLWRKFNTPFYYHFRDDLTDFRMSSRGRKDPGPRILYLSSATLIVVPSSLIMQWNQEILKHLEEYPRVLIARSKTVLPLVRDIATEYDIILMTYSRFCDEDRKADINSAHAWSVCRCPEFPDSRIPNCKCELPEISPLLQIRWKRLIIDEGHVSSSLSTRLTPFAKLLSVQARWIVTGTPTTNMLGLSFGGSSSGENPSDTESSPPELRTDTSSNATSLQPGDGFLFGDHELETSHPPLTASRFWGSSDNRDISKLMNMISQFIGVKFLVDPQVIRTNIKEAIFTNAGPRPGALEMLTNLMKMVMIRHRTAEVEKEITLPTLTQEIVLLDLEPYAILSYNMLQAVIVINAIDSERKDQDYMFHPSNVEYLQRTVKNMSQLMFWSVDSNHYNVDELVKLTEQILLQSKSNAKHISPDDLVLAKKALRHVQSAYRSSIWRELQNHEDIPYQVFNIPATILKAWTRLDGSAMIHPDRLLQLREQVLLHPLSDEAKLVSMGQEVAEADLLARKLYKELENKESKRKDRPAKQQSLTTVSTGTNDYKTRNAVQKGSSADKIKEMQRELQAALARLDALEDDIPVSSSLTALKLQPSVLLRQSPVTCVRIGKTASSKLNYIIEEVQKYASDEKFLIFSESPLTLAHVYEALTLLQIKSLQFTTQSSQLVREQLVLTFETSDVYRVFLMELKHGARGLNLTTASRVIFCEPVWQADVESQAIKRAHRIGQVRPVSVKTLAIRGTAEEKMLDRRQEFKKDGSKAPKLLEETGMRHFIEHPEFLELPDDQTVATGAQIDFSLFHLPPTGEIDSSSAAQSSSSHKRSRTEDITLRISSTQSPPKRRVVHFG